MTESFGTPIDRLEDFLNEEYFYHDSSNLIEGGEYLFYSQRHRKLFLGKLKSLRDNVGNFVLEEGVNGLILLDFSQGKPEELEGACLVPRQEGFKAYLMSDPALIGFLFEAEII